VSFFGTILEKLGLRKHSTASTAGQSSTRQPAGQRDSVTPQGSGTRPGSPNQQGSGARPGSAAPSGAAAPPQSVAVVDVVGHLEELAAKNPQKLNWRTSIVDLLKLLDIDSSLAARKELADELGAPADFKDGSAEMNNWLHRTVLQRIADNGGNVPKELLN